MPETYSIYIYIFDIISNINVYIYICVNNPYSSKQLLKLYLESFWGSVYTFSFGLFGAQIGEV